MNEKSEPVAPQGLRGSADIICAGGASPAVRPVASEVDELRGQDLRRPDLTKYRRASCPSTSPAATSPATKLPDEIKKFPALEQVKAISGEARKVFIALLAACVYSWLVIGTTKDVALILNTASSPLPIINTRDPDRRLLCHWRVVEETRPEFFSWRKRGLDFFGRKRGLEFFRGGNGAWTLFGLEAGPVRESG